MIRSFNKKANVTLHVDHASAEKIKYMGFHISFVFGMFQLRNKISFTEQVIYIGLVEIAQ